MLIEGLGRNADKQMRKLGVGTHPELPEVRRWRQKDWQFKTILDSMKLTRKGG